MPKHVFGPVPSRRLGQSLGIDPIPLKTCSWNCVYCQLGATGRTTMRRREFLPAEEILAQVREALGSHGPGEIDWVTFVGSGEPTLHSRLGWMIREVRKLTALPIAVITNGSLLFRPQVREELAAADAVLPTLDAGSPELHARMNRPHRKLGYDDLVRGLIEFRADFDGKLWVEVMLVRDLNDHEEDLADLARVMERVKPDAIHLNLPIRCPAESWVRPSDAEGIARAERILGEAAVVVVPTEGVFDIGGRTSPVEAVIDIVTRHPMRDSELLRALEQRVPERVREVIEELGADDRVRVVERSGVRFWCAAETRRAGVNAD